MADYNAEGGGGIKWILRWNVGLRGGLPVSRGWELAVQYDHVCMNSMARPGLSMSVVHVFYLYSLCICKSV